MRLPWLSFGAAAIVVAVATAELVSRNQFADVGAVTAANAVSDTPWRAGKHGAPPLLPGAPQNAPPNAPQNATTNATANAAPNASTNAPDPPRLGAPSTLIIPVAGVSRGQLTDTWGAARAAGRVHEGVDIQALQGTPVLAAADGRIVKFFDSERGGVTIYEFDASERFVYYYAHLLARAPGLGEGYRVRQGQVIGYVGMTGNALTPHLHFEVERLGPEHHWWQAEAMNPYPLLMAGQAPSA